MHRWRHPLRDSTSVGSASCTADSCKKLIDLTVSLRIQCLNAPISRSRRAADRSHHQPTITHREPSAPRRTISEHVGARCGRLKSRGSGAVCPIGVPRRSNVQPRKDGRQQHDQDGQSFNRRRRTAARLPCFVHTLDYTRTLTRRDSMAPPAKNRAPEFRATSTKKPGGRIDLPPGLIANIKSTEGCLSSRGNAGRDAERRHRSFQHRNRRCHSHCRPGP